MLRKSKSKKVAGASCEDRISDLPDEILQHVLGFLPVQQAVLTCVLARRWRHLWKTMRILRITRECSWRQPGDQNKFMNGLLLLRHPEVPLDEVEFTGTSVRQENETNMKIWIRHVLLRHVQVLLVDMWNITFHGPPLVAQYLRKLKLATVHLDGNFLNFASCPVLEDLEIIHCGLSIDILSSQSLKHLIIEDSRLFWQRIHVSAPNLISLQLKDNGGKCPLFEDMHSLETAIFSFGTMDYCNKCTRLESFNRYTEGDKECSGLILGGLSSATNLELIIYRGTLIFSRWCPTFTKMKNLLLHVPSKFVDLQWMVCILEHAPMLENLTLQVPKVLDARESHGSYDATVQLSTISEHLEVVEIKCGEVDERVYKILKLLSRLVKHISINQTDEPLALLCLKKPRKYCGLSINGQLQDQACPRIGAAKRSWAN